MLPTIFRTRRDPKVTATQTSKQRCRYYQVLCTSYCLCASLMVHLRVAGNRSAKIEYFDADGLGKCSYCAPSSMMRRKGCMTENGCCSVAENFLLNRPKENNGIVQKFEEPTSPYNSECCPLGYMKTKHSLSASGSYMKIPRDDGFLVWQH